MIGVVVAALETGVVVVGDRAPGPLRLAVVLAPFVTTNKWTQNAMREVVQDKDDTFRSTTISYVPSTVHVTRFWTLRNLLLQA